jgi:hypothetical protein
MLRRSIFCYRIHGTYNDYIARSCKRGLQSVCVVNISHDYFTTALCEVCGLHRIAHDCSDGKSAMPEIAYRDSPTFPVAPKIA